MGLGELAGWVARKRAEVEQRKTAFEALFATNSHGYQLVSAGAYFGYVRHPFGAEPAAAVAKRLADEQNILCLPGSMFGPGQEACLRFAYANVSVEMIGALEARLGG